MGNGGSTGDDGRFVRTCITDHCGSLHLFVIPVSSNHHRHTHAPELGVTYIFNVFVQFQNESNRIQIKIELVGWGNEMVIKKNIKKKPNRIFVAFVRFEIFLFGFFCFVGFRGESRINRFQLKLNDWTRPTNVSIPVYFHSISRLSFRTHIRTPRNHTHQAHFTLTYFRRRVIDELTYARHAHRFVNQFGV